MYYITSLIHNAYFIWVSGMKMGEKNRTLEAWTQKNESQENPNRRTKQTKIHIFIKILEEKISKFKAI